MKNNFVWVTALLFSQIAAADWFEDVKVNGSDEELYRALYYMPKGGDLHNHLSGSNFSEWWYDLALEQKARGYEYYTRVQIENCVMVGDAGFGALNHALMFRNISDREYESLNACKKSEYKALANLDVAEKNAWLDSLRLDKPFEGREEFFQTHWQRLNALGNNPYLQAETLVRNMQALGAEGVTYLETQVSVGNFVSSDGSKVSMDEAVDILRERLAQQDAKDTGVMVRFQIAVLRFLPSAEDSLRTAYKFVHDNAEDFVAINFVGREDNDKGYPLRFLPTLRELRRQYSGVNLSIHAGEVDEPNRHVADTLLLGADRIGHGLNLISDDETMRDMRHGPYLVEINLISNMLLGYVSEYSQHPFPEYLRTGIPVALSTDDRGMWDSTMTDEFFVAVKEFNLSWDEIKSLSQNSLQYAFVPDAAKRDLLDGYADRISKFDRSMDKY
ncbi:MAG: adenosine deaminase family protein, partial [Woeseiales bacterium]